MVTIRCTVAKMTNAVTIMQNIKSALLDMDPEFPAIEARFQSAISQLSDTTIQSIENQSCIEELISYEILFFFWSGFLFNLECFRTPAHALLLQQDFDRFLPEQKMMKIPIIQSKYESYSAYIHSVSSEQQEPLEVMTDYYAYMQTVGYKIAHYIGFRVADLFGAFIIPGHCSDNDSSLYYRNKLTEYLQLPIHKLD